MKLPTFIIIALSVLSATSVVAKSSDSNLCASIFDKTLVRDYYVKNPGQPLPVPSRDLAIVESKVAGALPKKNSIGVKSTAKRFAKIWRSIDAWGSDSTVGIVVTINGWHAFNFPSSVPVTQEKHQKGFYDVFADDGQGLRAHINPNLVGVIYATQIPNGEKPVLAVSFYDKKGDLITGVYAGDGGKTISDKVAKGFDNTWALINSMPRACKK